MNMDIQSKLTALLAQHGRKISIAGGGVVFGLLLLLTITWVVDLALAPAVPDIQTASAEQVAAFLANKRGFSRLPINDRRKMLFEIWSSSQELSDGMGEAFARLSSRDRGQVRIEAMRVAMDHLVRAARSYRKLNPKERDKYIEDFLDEHEALRVQLRGMVDSFKDSLPTRSNEWTKSIVTQTTARQRAQVKPFVDHLARVAEQRKMASGRKGKSSRRARRG